MPVFQLTGDLVFPDPSRADFDGLLAVGGDLGIERLLLSYRLGIFPWYSDGDPILWWSPDPRIVLFPEELKVSRSLRQTIKKGIFRVTLDTAFEEVIRNCATVHKKRDGGTWITEEMIEAYIDLHNAGYAHSVESWLDNTLAGGLYGVSLGGVFFGESMFTLKNNASKVAFVKLTGKLVEWDFPVIDCQITTDHMIRFGARELPRPEFMTRLKRALKLPTRKGKWTI